MSTAAKGAASRKGGGARAAKAEKDAEETGERVLVFHGLSLDLPPKLPASFSYRYAQLTGSENENELGGSMYRCVVSVIGSQQFGELCDHIDEIEDDVDDDVDISLMGFLSALIREYGSDEGESPASDDS